MSPGPGPASVVPSNVPRTDGSSVSSRSAIMSLSDGMVGVFSYGGTLLFTHLLDAPSFSSYAAAAMLLGMVGTFTSALIPLPLVHAIRSHGPGSEGRRQALSFAWLLSGLAGAVAAVVTAAITATFAPMAVVGAVALSAVTLFALSPIWGWLHGELRFVRSALLTVVEVAARVAFGAVVVLLGWGAGGALLGFVVGCIVVVALTPRGILGDLGWRPAVLRERARWSETRDIALSQLITSTLVGADVVLIAVLNAPATEAAGYQALSTLAKGPVYIATGAVVVAFPLLRTPGAHIDHILKAALRSCGLLAVLTAGVVATAPPDLVLLLLPERYAGSIRLLPALAAAGIGYAAVTMFTTVLLGLRAYRRCQVGLIVAVVLLPVAMVTGWQLGGVPGLASGTAAAALGGAVAMAVAARPLLPPGTAGMALRGLAAAAALLGLLTVTRPVPVLWSVCVVLAGLGTLRLVHRGGTPADDDPEHQA